MEDFQLTQLPIQDSPPLDLPDSSGALVEFRGRVRDHNIGRPVRALDYSSYSVLALKEGRKILAEARVKFSLQALRAVHRIGSLRIGDDVLLVQTASPRRQEAFAACRWIVDEVKLRVPIWKKEHYADGDSAWIVPRPEDGTD